MALIIRLAYTHENKLNAHLMVSSQVCNASIPELVKTTHVMDKLLSGQSTVLTREVGGDGTPYLSRKAYASEI